MAIVFPAPTQADHRVRIAVAALFVALIATGPVGWFLIDRTTPTLVHEPELRLADVLDGSWQKAEEEWLREMSPPVRFARTQFLDFEWLLGLVDNHEVTSAAPGWLFNGESLRTVDRPELAAARRDFWTAVAARSKKDGVRILVLIAPDKARIYPREATGRDALDASRDAILARGMEEIRAAGLEAIEVEQAFREHLRAFPADPLYARRDTHWNPAAAAIAAGIAVDAVRATGIDLGPPYTDSLMTPELVSQTDLVERTLGLGEGTRGGELLRERHRFAVAASALGAHPDARVALVGDSFSVTNFASLFAVMSGRRLDTAEARPGSGPWRGLLDVLQRIESGASQARVVLVVFVERSIANDVWREAAAKAQGGPR